MIPIDRISTFARRSLALAALLPALVPGASFAQIIGSTEKMVYLQQGVVLTEKATSWKTSLTVADPSKPVMVALSWNDRPALAKPSPIPMNDLNLVVAGSSRVGPVFFVGNDIEPVNGFSNPYGNPAKGTPDSERFVEWVVIDPMELSDNPEITLYVEAATLAVDCFRTEPFSPRQGFSITAYNVLP